MQMRANTERETSGTCTGGTCTPVQFFVPVWVPEGTLFQKVLYCTCTGKAKSQSTGGFLIQNTSGTSFFTVKHVHFGLKNVFGASFRGVC